MTEIEIGVLERMAAIKEYIGDRVDREVSMQIRRMDALSRRCVFPCFKRNMMSQRNLVPRNEGMVTKSKS